MGPGESPSQALGIVHVAGDDLGALGGQLAGLGRVDVARDGARVEPALGVAQDRAHQASALRAGGAHHRNDLAVAHVDPPRE